MQLFVGMTESVETKLGFVAERAKRDKSAIFDRVMHLINEESLKASFQQLRKDGAVGIDGLSWEEYDKNLEANIKGLMLRIRKMSYRPQPVRRVYIPKDNGEQRPIGIPSIEDKMVQKAMSRIMEAIYEQYFHEESYGFRIGRGCHQALKKVNDLMKEKPINHVIEVDIKGFFNNMEHEKLMEWLRIRITDGCFLRYVTRFLKSGYMEAEAFKSTEKGTPQGGNISPMLANVFLHYVLDNWFDKEIKPRLKGQGHMVRYCDDLVILVQNKEEAEMIHRELKVRLEANGLEANAEKTQAIPIVLTKIAIFKGKQIRKIIHNNEWWFSVIDVVQALTETERPRKYWSDLKKKLIQEGYVQLSEKIGQLKLRAMGRNTYYDDLK